jgi:adenine C2-methylase RlmN of 23S rRNA A2503 and tRNA A37
MSKNKTATQTVCEQLKDAGFDFAIAIATEPEIKAGAACGQLSLITAKK